MIYFLRGTVHSFGLDYVIIDCNGVGYYVYFSHQDQITLGQQLTVYTYQQFREDAQLLFGFLEEKELDLFKNLIGVKGLGPKTAMNMLSYSRYSDIINAIENGEADVLSRIPGLGAKTSKQIILDLKGKLVQEDNNGLNGTKSVELQEAVAALKNLGYKTYEINAVLPQLKNMEGLSADEYLKAGLKLLLQQKGV